MFDYKLLTPDYTTVQHDFQTPKRAAKIECETRIIGKMLCELSFDVLWNIMQILSA